MISISPNILKIVLSTRTELPVTNYSYREGAIAHYGSTKIMLLSRWFAVSFDLPGLVCLQNLAGEGLLPLLSLFVTIYL